MSGWILATFLLVAALPCSAQKSVALAASTVAPRAVVDQYCAVCHNQKNATAGVNLSAPDLLNPATNAPLMERVLRKFSTGEMPPAGMPRPAGPVTAAFTKSLEDSLDRAAGAHPNAGHPAVHRLNRAEYSNAIRDILAVDTDPGSLLPVDDSGYGFDNIGDVLSVSPALLERYMSTARLVARLAVGNTKMEASVQEFAAHPDQPGTATRERNERASDDLPFDSRGGFVLRHYFPVDAEYAICIRAGGGGGAGGGAGAGRGAPLEVRMPITAGLHSVGVTFLRENTKPEISLRGGPGPANTPPPPPPPAGAGGRGAVPGAVPGMGGRGAAPAQLDLRLDGARLKLFDLPERAATQPIQGLTLSGPYNITGPGNTPPRARIFICHPASPAEEEPCARNILSTVGHRAFRRPVTDADLRPLLAFYQAGRAERDFDFGIEKALRALLVSPDFLFRTEVDPQKSTPGTAYRISDLDLASRLSFFLWSSVPDDQLLDLAEKGKLKDPAVLEAQVRRLLADPRSQSLVSNFAGQWLYIRNLSQVKPDPDAFPEFDESLRKSFQQETELFFQSILREDRSMLDLLDANYTFLNQRLAEHYGIPNIYGSQFRRVTLTDPNRGGLLGQGSILTVTSYPNRTSVVQRGKWILDNLLGSPPPPPPPDIPDLKPHAKDGRALSMREAMEMHRSNSICQSCHARMDPIGFALENYDGVGKWRDKDGGGPIDATGKLPGGVQFEKAAGLKKILAANYRDQFEATVTEKLLTYALGRGVESYDMPSVRAIMREASTDNFRITALISAIVKSTPFQMRSTPEP